MKAKPFIPVTCAQPCGDWYGEIVFSHKFSTLRLDSLVDACSSVLRNIENSYLYPPKLYSSLRFSDLLP